MEFVEPQKNYDLSLKHASTADDSQHVTDHSLLSIKTLKPWQIPEQHIVSVLPDIVVFRHILQAEVENLGWESGMWSIASGIEHPQLWVTLAPPARFLVATISTEASSEAKRGAQHA